MRLGKSEGLSDAQGWALLELQPCRNKKAQHGDGDGAQHDAQHQSLDRGGEVQAGAHVDLAVGQNQWYHFGVDAPPSLVDFSGDWDVHWGLTGVLTHLWHVHRRLSHCRHHGAGERRGVDVRPGGHEAPAAQGQAGQGQHWGQHSAGASHGGMELSAASEAKSVSLSQHG